MDIVQRIFKSLAGKTRLDILLLLLEKGELTVNEISSILHRQVSTISRKICEFWKKTISSKPAIHQEMFTIR